MEENNKKNSNGINIASLVLGIISIASSLFWYITLPTGILSIIFGTKSIKTNGKTMGKAGLITGIIGLSLFAFIYISLIIILLLAHYQ